MVDLLVTSFLLNIVKLFINTKKSRKFIIIYLGVSITIVKDEKVLIYIRLIIGKLSIVSQPIEPIIACRIFQPITITNKAFRKLQLNRGHSILTIY